MFEETLGKYALVLGLFVVFLILGNYFAATQHSANKARAGSRRRRRRRPTSRQIIETPSASEDLQTHEAEDTSQENSEVARKAPFWRRRLVTQIIVSSIGLVFAAIALYMMWLIAQQTT